MILRSILKLCDYDIELRLHKYGITTRSKIVFKVGLEFKSKVRLKIVLKIRLLKIRSNIRLKIKLEVGLKIKLYIGSNLICNVK